MTTRAADSRVVAAIARCTKRICADAASGKKCDVCTYMNRYKALRELQEPYRHSAWLQIYNALMASQK